MYEYTITMDSFGQDCPSNWEEIADALNAMLDELAEIYDDERDLRDAAEAVWSKYWSDGIEGVPAPLMD